MTTAEISCSVCAGIVAAHTASRCDSCGAIFHLNQRTDLPGEDCGDVWIDESHMGLRFRCNICLRPATPVALDDILDLEEAAEECGIDVITLVQAAERGDIPHRKTRGGAYLFERGALLDYMGEPS